MRRALRLFPALILVVCFVVFYVWLIGTPQSLKLTLYNAQGVLFYYFNWQLVLAFPEYLRHQWMYSHLWSLSVEEQFYIVWPLITLMLLRLGGREARFIVVIVGIVAPAIARAMLWTRQPSLEWYFRTDLRFDGLMWGALAALLLDLGVFPNASWRRTISWSALIALAGLFIIASFDGLSNGFLYLVGFSIVGMLSAILIYCAVSCAPTDLLRFLEFIPLRWVGRISYGLYLWHWPIIRAVSALDLEAIHSVLLEFPLTFLAATLSFYFWERPILSMKKRFIVGQDSKAKAHGTST